MLASPCCIHGSLAFDCMLLCKGALYKFRIVLLIPLQHLEAGYAPISHVYTASTGKVVRIHEADFYRYCTVHHSDLLKNAITCKWSFFVRSFNINGIVVTNGKWFHRCVTTWWSPLSCSITPVLHHASFKGFRWNATDFKFRITANVIL